MIDRRIIMFWRWSVWLCLYITMWNGQKGLNQYTNRGNRSLKINENIIDFRWTGRCDRYFPLIKSGANCLQRLITSSSSPWRFIGFSESLMNDKLWVSFWWSTWTGGTLLSSAMYWQSVTFGPLWTRKWHSSRFRCFTIYLLVQLFLHRGVACRYLLIYHYNKICFNFMWFNNIFLEIRNFGKKLPCTLLCIIHGTVVIYAYR